MNEILQGIKKIDLETEKLRKQTEDLLKSETENTHRVISNLEENAETKLKKEVESMMIKIKSETALKIKKLKIKSDENVNSINSVYAENKGQLLDEIFLGIIGNYDEE